MSDSAPVQGALGGGYSSSCRGQTPPRQALSSQQHSRQRLSGSLFTDGDVEARGWVTCPRLCGCQGLGPRAGDPDKLPAFTVRWDGPPPGAVSGFASAPRMAPPTSQRRETAPCRAHLPLGHSDQTHTELWALSGLRAPCPGRPHPAPAPRPSSGTPEQRLLRERLRFPGVSLTRIPALLPCVCLCPGNPATALLVAPKGPTPALAFPPAPGLREARVVGRGGARTRGLGSQPGSAT